MIEDWIRDNIIVPFNDVGIEVQNDAYALILMACRNQLESRNVSTELALIELLSELSGNFVSAYIFKFGHNDLTFGRAIRLLGDVAERWQDLRKTSLVAKMDRA